MVSLLTSRCPLKDCGSFGEGFHLLLSSAFHRCSKGVRCYCLGLLKLLSDNSLCTSGTNVSWQWKTNPLAWWWVWELLECSSRQACVQNHSCIHKLLLFMTCMAVALTVCVRKQGLVFLGVSQKDDAQSLQFKCQTRDNTWTQKYTWNKSWLWNWATI